MLALVREGVQLRFSPLGQATWRIVVTHGRGTIMPGRTVRVQYEMKRCSSLAESHNKVKILVFAKVRSSRYVIPL